MKKLLSTSILSIGILLSACGSDNKTTSNKNTCISYFNKLEKTVQGISNAQLSMDDGAKERKNNLVKEKYLTLNEFYQSIGLGELSAEVRINDWGGNYIEILSSNANDQKKEAIKTCKPYLDDTQNNQLDFFLPDYF